MGESFYSHHVFFCTNQRKDGSACCQDFGADELRVYAKDKVKSAGLVKPGGVRVNSAGCLNRCELGPVVVVYPEAVWYNYVDKEDIDEIVDKHLVKGEIVERLRISDDKIA